MALVAPRSPRGFREKAGRENWVSDTDAAKCGGCAKAFTMVRRRHHCRKCGGVFCNDCTGQQAMVPTGEGGMQGGLKRVCRACYDLLAALPTVPPGEQQSADAAYVLIALRTVRQQQEGGSEASAKHFAARMSVLSRDCGGLLKEVGSLQQTLGNARLFSGRCLDGPAAQLAALAAAYERRCERVDALRRCAAYAPTLRFVATVHSALAPALLAWVVEALTPGGADAVPRLCGAAVPSPTVRQHVLRSCGDGASARELCEQMQDLAEAVALRLAGRYAEQLHCLTDSGAEGLAESCIARIATFLLRDCVPRRQKREPAEQLLAAAVEAHPKITGPTPLHLETRERERDPGWEDNELLRTAGIKTAANSHWHVAGCRGADPHRYYYRLGTDAEAAAAGMVPTGADRRCPDPVESREGAESRLWRLLRQRSELLHSYFRTPGVDADGRDDAAAALSRVRDLLSTGCARYAERMAQQAGQAAESVGALDTQVERAEAAVRALGGGEAAGAARYFAAEHALRCAALHEFAELLRCPGAGLLYARMRLKLLEQLLAHRAVSAAELPAWPDISIGGTTTQFDSRLHSAAEEAVNSQRCAMGQRTVCAIDEASHVAPRWLTLRFAAAAAQLAPAGCLVLADALLARLLSALPDPSEGDEGAAARRLLATGTLTPDELAAHSQRQPPALGSATCLRACGEARSPQQQQQQQQGAQAAQLLQLSKLRLPTLQDANWKECSLQRKSGIRTPRGTLYHRPAAPAQRGDKPGKYCYCAALAAEAAALGMQSGGPPPPAPPPAPAGADQSQRATASGADALIFSPPQPEAASLLNRRRHQFAHASAPDWVLSAFPPGAEVTAGQIRGEGSEVSGRRGRVVCVFTDGPNSGRVLVTFAQPEAPGHVEHVLRPECLGVGAEQGALAPGSDGGGPRREADRPLHWAHSTVTAAPPSAPAGTRVHCTLVTRDAEGRRCPGAMAEDLRVVVFGEGCEATAVQPVAGDGAAFEFSFTTQRTGAAVVGCAWCNDWGPCALVQVTPAGVDLLQRSVIDVRPAVCAAGEVMRGRVVPRDTWGNAAATVSPEDFTMCVRNAGVELCTTPLERGADGALEFSFVPVAEGEVEVSAGCGGLVLQCAQPLACRAGDADWGRSIVQPSAFELGVGDMVPGDVVLRDSYGNCAAPKAGSGRPTLAAVLPERVPLPLSALAGDEGDEEGAGGGEHGFELECTRRGLLLLHCASSATGEGVVAKVSVGGGVLPVHWGRTTVSLAPRCVEAGAELTCTVLPRDRYGNVLDQGPAPEDFVVEIRTSAGARSAAGPLRRCPGGALLLTVTAKQAGEAWAELSRRPAEVEAGAAGRAAEEGPKRSNEVTVVAAALSWASSEVVLPPEARAGETVTATVRARDRLGNPCAALEPEDVTLLALNQDTRVPHSAPQRDPSGEPGVFSFTFVPTAAGAAVVRAAYGGASTESRPCRILPGRMDWERSSVVLDRRRQAAGRPLRCEVIFRDAWGNETCDGPESLRGFTVSACRPQGRPLVGEGELFIAEPEPLLAPPEERRTTVHEAETAPVAEERDPENQPEAESSPVVQSEQTLSQGGARGAAGAAGPGYSRFCVLIEPRIAGDLEAQVEFADVTLSSEPAAVVPAEISWEHSRIVLRGDSATAGQPLHGELRTQDRFGNVSDTMAFTEDEDMTPTPARLSDFALSAAVAGGGRRKGEREDPRVEPRAEGAAAGVLPFTLIPRLAGVLAVTASFHAAPGSPLRAECPVLGGEPLWGSTTVSLEPAEAHAGGELRAVVLLRDACGNEARPGCPLRVLVRNEQDEHLAQPPLPGADGDSVFTVVVIRAGTARAYVTPGGEAAATESAVESNDVQVRAGARCLARTTIEWVSPEGTVAGAVLEGVATFRDEFGNPTAGSAGDVRIEADNAGVPCGVDAAPQEPGACTVRFTCQPTKRGPVCATLVGIADGATVRGPPAAVAPAELHWPSCSLEWAAPPPPAEGVPEVRAGERAAAALTCRDRFGNLALPEGGAAAFSVEFATDGSPLPPPEPRLPGAGPPSEAGSVFTLEVCPTAAGRGELAVGYRADPAAQPLRCALDIQAGEIDWGCSVVEADLAEVQAGEAVLYTIRLRDAHGNPAACRDPTVFTPTVTNAGAECAGVSAVSGSGSTFSFTAEPATAGTVQAAVTYAGALGAAPLRSSTTTVVPGPIDFASCTLAILQTPAAAGEPCRAMLTLKDRFGNPAALPEGTTPADFSCSITNTGEQEVRELPSCEPLRQGQAPHELLLVFEPELKGRVEVEMLMKGSYHTQSAACPCVSGRPFSQTSKVDLHPQEVTAGDEVQATVTLCDVKGNAADFSLGTMVVVVENAGAAPPPSALAPVEGGFCFSFRPTKKGTARVTVRDKASPLDIASEEVAVRCGPLCAATTTAVLEPSPVVAGERCRLRILPCDQHRNPLCDGDAQGAAALIADLALQPRNGSAEIPAPTLTPAGGGALVCEFVPTERGHASVEASGREVAVRSNPVEVRSAAIHWPSCETAWVPTGRPRCGVPAGGKATAAITCRDRFGNPAFPGAADKKFLKGGFVVSAQTEGGAQLAPPAVYAPGKTPLAEASTFHFDLTLVAAGETEVQVRLAGDPGAPAHTVHAAVEGGPLCWPKCTLSLEEKEVDAGTKLVYTLLLVDAHGNPATGADAAMFTPVVDNSGCNLDVSAVRGEGSCFTFEATPTAAGKAAGAVGYVKEPKKQVKAPVCTVRPGPPHWPSCELAFADGTAAAGEECRLRLLLRDEHGNPSTLARGPLRLADISFDITNTGVEGAPPQELRPLRPPENPPKGPHEVWAAVEPALKGRLAARCAAPGRDPLTAECEVVGGRPNSRTSTVTLEPAGGVLAGETVTATVQVRDAKGNPTDFSLKAMVPSASSEGQGPAPRCSDPEPVPGGFRFTFAPTRSGTAQGAVRDKQSKLDIRSEPVPVRCGPFCPEKSTVAAEPPKQHAGVPCKVTVRARDRFGNDLGQEQGRLQELRSAAALSVRNGEAAVDPAPLEVSGGTLVSQFTPTKVGQAEAELRIDGATARSNTVQVGPGPMHWPECTVEFLDSGGKTRSSAVAGARVTAVVLPRDRFGNPTVAGSKAPFSFQFKHQPREGAAAPHPAHDTPVPYAPPGAGQQRGPPPEQAGELRFDLAPTAAGRLRLDLASAAEPAAEPHTLELDVSPGEICWPKCTVRTATQTVTAGEEIKASIHLVDAYGNAATGAHASMFTAALRDGSDAGGPVVSGSESDFEFTMRPTRAGGQAAAVTLSGQQQAVESNPFTVLPAPVHFPACQLALREGVACAGEPCAVLLTLRDRFGNLTPLAGPAGDFRLTMFNLGDDQSSERGSVKPLPLSSPPERGAAPHEVVACCEPELRGTLEVKCTMDGDSHMHQVTVAVESGRPSVRTSTVTVDPEAVRAGETVTVRIALSDAKGNRPKCTAEELTVQVGNDGAPVQPTELQETADGFSCTFVPTKAGKAVAQFKDTRSAFAMEQAVAVRCGPLDPVKSQVRLSSDRVCAGDPLTATAHLVDSYGNSLCSDPEWISKEAKLEVKNGFAQVKPEGIEVKGGALHCRFCPTSSRAKCHLAVSVPGLSKEVARSGETEVRPAPLSWEHSTVVIDDEEARVGEPLTLVVTMKDRFKNVTDGGKADQFRVRILNAGADFSEQDVRLMGKDGSSTAFSAQFVPLEPGQVQVEVEYQGGAPKKSNTIPVHA